MTSYPVSRAPADDVLKAMIAAHTKGYLHTKGDDADKEVGAMREVWRTVVFPEGAGLPLYGVVMDAMSEAINQTGDHQMQAIIVEMSKKILARAGASPPGGPAPRDELTDALADLRRAVEWRANDGGPGASLAVDQASDRVRRATETVIAGRLRAVASPSRGTPSEAALALERAKNAHRAIIARQGPMGPEVTELVRSHYDLMEIVGGAVLTSEER